MITPRLKMILDHITGNVIADLGTDHAYIPIELAKKGGFQGLIATDVRPGPLAAAREHIKKAGVEDKIDLRLGSGLDPLAENEADTVLICGMGGILISEILASDLKKAKHVSLFLLQPMNGQYELRKWLIKHSFEILEEDISCEGFKVYSLILARYGEKQTMPCELSLHLPETLLAHPLYPKLRDKKKREFEKIRNGQKCSSCPDQKEILYYQTLLSELEERDRHYETI